MVENLLKGNEINLDELVEVAKKMAEESNPELEILEQAELESAESNESKMQLFERIVKGVAYKYAVSNFGVEREDLEQDLWVKVFELINQYDGIENINGKMVAKRCWNEAVDKYRYHRRRRDNKAEYSDETENEESETRIQHAEFQNGLEAVYIRETIELFPEGSKERKYIVTKLYMFGEIDEETYDGPDKLELPEDDSEFAILKLLGYESRYPSSWGKKKYGMRDKIYRYLGRIANDENEELDRVTVIGNRVEQMMRESRCDYLYMKDKVMKDKVLKVLNATQEEVLQAIYDSSNIVIGLNKDKVSIFLMKRKESAMNLGKSLGDTFLNE